MADTVIDAEGAILGRLASEIAARLKDGETVHVVNAERAVVSGDPEETYEKYRQKREAGSIESGPDFPKAPDRIVKRTVRGMLPNGADGREAFKRLRTYRGNPDGLETDDIDIKRAEALQGRNSVTVESISANI